MTVRTRSLWALVSALLLSSGLLALRGIVPAEVAPSERAYWDAIAEILKQEQAGLERRTDLWEDHSTWDDAWIVEGENFSVRTTHSRSLGLEILEGQESMRGFIKELLEGPDRQGDACPIFLLADRAAYNTFGNDHGEHHSSILGGFYATGHPEQPIATYLDASRTRTQMWITHNVVHHYLGQNFRGQVPVWVSEGLASYFALFWDFGYGVRELATLKQEGRLVPFDKLTSESLSAYPSDPHARFIQLGMLFSYLLRFNEDTRRLEGESLPLAPFDEFLRASVRGTSVDSLPFSLYLDEQSEALLEGFLECEFE
ncbi:MAG: hypothetical protein ACI8QC_003433 [Planctomycetota bacterium]|jgi:hypothetical protein